MHEAVGIRQDANIIVPFICAVSFASELRGTFGTSVGMVLIGVGTRIGVYGGAKFSYSSAHRGERVRYTIACAIA